MTNNLLLLAGATVISLGLIPCSTSAVEPSLASAKTEWHPLFDGKSLGAWKSIERGEFEKHGPVEIKEGTLFLQAGKPATGIRWTGEFPKSNFELEWECQRVAGHDFFCGLTFPVQEGSLSLILGGWGGRVAGLSCLDGAYAVDNETMAVFKFESETWYRLRLRVTPEAIKVWFDDELFVELDSSQYKLTVSDEMQPCLPLGIATWNTTGALRKIRFRKL
jgi:hypothetical protein